MFLHNKHNIIDNLSVPPLYPNMGDRLLANVFTSYYIGNSPTIRFEVNVPVLIATIQTNCFIKVGFIETSTVIPDNTLVWVMLTYNDVSPEAATTSTILYKRLRKTLTIDGTKYYMPPDLDALSSWIPVAPGANVFVIFGNTFDNGGVDLIRVGGCRSYL